MQSRRRRAKVMSLDQALIEVWRQALTEQAKTVVLRSKLYTVRRTPKRGECRGRRAEAGDHGARRQE